MARILVTGSADGLGRGVAERLLDDGHEVVTHVRSPGRRSAVDDLVARGAEVVVADLAARSQVEALADQLDAGSPFDAVVHNAGVGDGPELFAVNVVAPYLLTARMAPARRLVYLSSSMHHGGRRSAPRESTTPRDLEASMSYSDTKWWDTALALAVARRCPDVVSNAVDPGWVRTRMGGRQAPGDLESGCATQVWLVGSDDPDALTSGGYWHHRRREAPDSLAAEEATQDRVLHLLAGLTGVELSGGAGPR